MAANNQALTVQIKADLSGLQKGLDKATSNLKAFGSKMKSFGSSMSRFVTVPLTAAGGVAVAQAVKFEKLATSLNVLTGSAEAGAVAFERIKQFSAQTPFQLEELVSVNNQLMGFGMNADQAFKSLQMLGDVSSVSGAQLDRVAIAFGQSAAAGRVMTQDLNQFINNGIPIYQLLGDVTGKNVGELRDLASQGGITFDLLNQAFVKATSEGGKFFEGTAKLSQTLGGRLSTLRDNFNLMMGEIGQLIGEALSPLIEVATTLFQSFANLSDNTKRIIVIVGGLVAAIGPLLVAFGTIAQFMPIIVGGFAALTSPISLAVGAIAALAAGVIYLADNWQAVKDRITDISWWRNALIDMVQFFIDYNPFNLIIEGINKVANFLGKEGVTNPFDLLKDKLEGLKVPVKDNKAEFGSFSDALQNALIKLKIIKPAIEDVTAEVTSLNTELAKTGTGTGGENDLGFEVDLGNVMKDDIAALESYEEALEKTAEKNAALTQGMSQGFSQLGHSIVNNLGEAETAMGRFLRALARNAIDVISVQLAQSLANAITGATQSGTATGPMAAFTTPAFIASAIGGVIGAFAALPKFANGGIVNGSSFSGDRVMARVNSGEMILNRSQQANLFGMINRGGGGNERLVTQIAGNDLRIVLERAQKTNQRLR